MITKPTQTVKPHIDQLRISNSTLVRLLSEEDTSNEWTNFNDLLESKVKENEEAASCVFVMTDVSMNNHIDSLWEWIQQKENIDVKIIILSQKNKGKSDFHPITSELIHLVLPVNMDTKMVLEVVEQAFEIIKVNQEKNKLKSKLDLTNRDIRSMARIGKLLGQEHEFDRLIRLILLEFQKLVFADSGSIYVVERNQNGGLPTHLRFKSTYLDLDLDEFLLPIDKTSIAGYVALEGKALLIDDVYNISDKEEYGFNQAMDKKYSYRTKSMMVVPMKDHKNQVIGVIQLINRKLDLSEKLSLEDMEGDKVIPFSNKDFEFADAMAGQAGVAIDNNFLLQDIQNLFEGFVTASVTAIEQRDPTTSGHSFRVSRFTVELAKVVDKIKEKPFEEVQFSKDQLREIRYAGLLHDFGKVGVRESVLLKAKKLYPSELEIIKWRYYLFREIINKNYFQDKVKFMEANGVGDHGWQKELQEKKDQKLAEIDEMFQKILEANEPSVLEEGNFQILQRMKGYKIKLHTGDIVPLLQNDEFLSLSVRRGSLNGEERKEIESHVRHTYSFLMQIPWTQDLRSVPNIAHGHHEKLDGSGYPLGLKEPEICIQTRMMTIADVYDALTAPDRPYKASLPKEKALDILGFEVKDQHIDPNLFDVFVKANVFNVCDGYVH